MNKLLFIGLVLFSGLFFSACNKVDVGNDINNSNDVVINESVVEYLENTNKVGEGESIKEGDKIVVDYIGRLEDGSVFDTSVESVAKESGVYQEGRDYEEGLLFEVGAGLMIKGFDEGVVGMKKGQTKTITFGPESGYGLYDESLVVKYTVDLVGDLSQYEKGMKVCLNAYECGIITEITNKDMTVDFNHELAGKTLIFDVTVKSIN